MKVLQVSKLYPPSTGGIETVVYDLVQEMALSNQIELIDVLAFSENTKSSVEKNMRGLVYRCASMFKFASTYVSIDFFLTWLKIRNEYDVVHVHVPNPLASLALTLLPTRAKVVVHWHSDIVKQKLLKRLLYPFQYGMLKKASRIVVTSAPYAEGSKDLRNFKSKVKVIPIGIDRDKLQRNKKVETYLSSEFASKKVVFALGRHVYYKGFEYLIESAKYLPNDYIVLIGGKGELTDWYLKLVQSAGLQYKVRFIGRVPDSELGGYYDYAKAFVLPSVDKSEAFGVVQLEAMSFGTPIVSCAIQGSGVSSVNKNGVTGIVCDPNKPKKLAEAIESVVSSDFEKEKIQSHFQTFYTRDKMATRFIELYEALV